MEKLIKNGIRVGIGAILIVLLYVLFAGGDSTESDAEKKKKENANELSILFGQGPSGGGSNKKEKSLFESDFFKSGNISYEEVQKEEGESVAEGDIPINPQTGKPYDEDAMNQFDRLRSKFPGNDLIPKRMTEEEKAAKKAQDERISQAARNVFSNQAQPDDVKVHYDSKLKQAKDRLEIIDYLINQKGMAAEDSDQADKVKQVFESIKKQYDAAEKERKDAFEKAGLEVYSLDSIGKR